MKTNIAPAQISPVLKARELRFGSGCIARSLRHDQFSGAIDPIISMMHYKNRETFPAHPVAGVSAVNYYLADTLGTTSCRDSLGNHIKARAGDLHWLAAGSGVLFAHKQPDNLAMAHGIRFLVNLPAPKKFMPPKTTHTPSEAMPVFFDAGVSVRIVTGETHGISAVFEPPEPFTLLDVTLGPGASFVQTLQAGWGALITVIEGYAHASAQGRGSPLPRDCGIGIEAGPVDQSILLRAGLHGAHLIFAAGRKLNEPIVEMANFVTNSREQASQLVADFQAGKLGSIRQTRRKARNVSI